MAGQSKDICSRSGSCVTEEEAADKGKKVDVVVEIENDGAVGRGEL